ncbi:hypothetical protein Vi05172_g6218 [Venturia inaequalis]|nr:hypothetical protein Vi05172_g6218 [Venturia inaequalis]
MPEGPGKHNAMVIVEPDGHVSVTKGYTCDAVGPMLELSEDEDGLLVAGAAVDVGGSTRECMKKQRGILELSIDQKKIQA